MVVKKIDDINMSTCVPSASSTQTLSSSTDFCTNTTTNNNNLSSHESETASNFNNINANQNRKQNIKTNLNKLISNSDILVKLDRNRRQEQQHQQRHSYRHHCRNDQEDKGLHPSLPQRIFYENILSDLKNNQKSPLFSTHANSNSTSSLNEQYILNFNYRNQFLNKTDSTKTPTTTPTAAAEKPVNANEAPSSTDDECLVEFIEDFNLEDDDFGSSLSTTSSSSHSDAAAAANQTSHNNNEIKLSYQQQKTNTLELPQFSSSISKSSDDVNSLSISDLSGSPISSSASSSNQTSEPSIDHVTNNNNNNNFTASSLTVETDLSNDADEAANDVCLLTPTQFSNFRHKVLDDKNENEEENEDEESRRNTVTYSTSSLLHEYQMKNNILTTISVENDADATPLPDHDPNSILLLRNELLNSNNPSLLSRQDSTKSKSKDSKLSSGKSTISSANSLFLACEVASLSSLTSDYSQFDFLANNNNANTVNSTVTTNKIVMPVADTYHVDTPTKKSSSNANSNGSITSFFFSNSLFGSKKSSTLNTPEKSSNITTCPSSNTNTNNLKSSQTHSQSVKISPTSNKTATTPTTTTANTNSSSSSNKTLDLIASKFFNLKSASTNKNNSKTIVNNPAPQIQDNKQNIEFSMATSSSSSSLVNFNSDSMDTYSDNTSLKTNHSFNNLAGVSSIQVPSSVLIFENRPR